MLSCTYFVLYTLNSMMFQCLTLYVIEAAVEKWRGSFFLTNNILTLISNTRPYHIRPSHMFFPRLPEKYSFQRCHVFPYMDVEKLSDAAVPALLKILPVIIPRLNKAEHPHSPLTPLYKSRRSPSPVYVRFNPTAV